MRCSPEKCWAAHRCYEHHLPRQKEPGFCHFPFLCFRKLAVRLCRLQPSPADAVTLPVAAHRHKPEPARSWCQQGLSHHTGVSQGSWQPVTLPSVRAGTGAELLKPGEPAAAAALGTPKHIVQRGCGVSILRDIHNQLGAALSNPL